jgi:hypothetical protein
MASAATCTGHELFTVRIFLSFSLSAPPRGIERHSISVLRSWGVFKSARVFISSARFAFFNPPHPTSLPLSTPTAAAAWLAVPQWRALSAWWPARGVRLAPPRAPALPASSRPARSRLVAAGRGRTFVAVGGRARSRPSAGGC